MNAQQGTEYGGRLLVCYDGLCPLCTREVKMIAKRDTREAIQFVDISAPDFSASSFSDQPLSELMAEIHARLPDGTLIRGVEVFRQMYERIGFSAVVGFSRVFGVRHALDVTYKVWAKNRLKLSGRCHGDSCPIDRGPSPTSG